LNEDLLPQTTYTLNFGNSLADFNEGNLLPDFEFVFATGSVIDSLSVTGRAVRAFDHKPEDIKESAFLVMLYTNLSDSAPLLEIPRFYGKANKNVLFAVNNLPPDTFRIIALKDANNNLMYDPGAEEFAFCDSLIIPSAVYEAEPDTLVFGADSLLITGHTLFKPDPVYLRTFTEKFFDQFIDKSFRESRYKCNVSFGESVKDTFNIRLLNQDAADWYSLEYNPEMDSLTIWVTDTLIARYDTLKLELAYAQLDSSGRKFIELDTLHLSYAEKERSEARKKKKEDAIPEIVQFNLANNLKLSGFDLNSPVLITSPEPVKKFDFNMVRLLMQQDTSFIPLKFTIREDTTGWRTYRIDYPWEAGTVYVLETDSMACRNIYGITSRKNRQTFKTQEEDYYGRIILNLGSVVNHLIVELLENSKDEKVLKTVETDKNGRVMYEYLPPQKYKVKIIFDHNRNGKWDTGSFKDKLQPERVAYLPEIVKVRSNWDSQYEWDLKPDPTFRKVLIDKEEEELRLKKLKEQQQKEKQQDGTEPGESLERQLQNTGRF